MKILVLNWQDIRNPLGGGAEVHLHEIFKRIAARGHSVTLFCSSFPGAPAEEILDGIRVIRSGSRNLFNYGVKGYYRRRFRQERYDVVVDDINKIPFYTPRFVQEPLVAIIHHLFDTSIFREASLPAALYVYGAEKLVPRAYRNTPLAVVSESTRSELIRKGFNESRITVIPNAVDTAHYRPHEVPQQQAPVVGSLGRLKKYKSADHLLDAFAIVRLEIPDAQLLVVGEGDYLPFLKRKADDLRLGETVTFTGQVDENEKVRLLNRMTLAVNCSAKEGWGLTVIEANACGVPVVASDVPGLRDAVLDEKTGLLYEYGNIEQLAAKIMLILRDERLRARLSREALSWARSFQWDDSAEKMLSVLERVAGVRK
ncbi:MAG: glycosyltransferase family 4 protein [Ignavibacteriae bacterium]|nr:glycosyltransferase family 4 protein [Ignavibacteriota bacterium]